jgi:hypothetical protein
MLCIESDAHNSIRNSLVATSLPPMDLTLKKLAQVPILPLYVLLIKVMYWP